MEIQNGVDLVGDQPPRSGRGLLKRFLIMLIAVGLVLGGIFTFISFKSRMIKQFMASQGMPTQYVATTIAGYQEWLPKMSAVGTLRAVEGADLSSEVAGIVSQIGFRQGDHIKAGTPVLQLRALDDAAKLQSLKAAANLARTTYERDRAQLKAKAISQQVLDNDLAILEQANANVAQQQALLDKKTIRAPFSGRLGPRLVNLGQFLDAGNPIVTLQALDKLYVDFLLPQQALSAVKLGRELVLQVDAFPDRVFQGEIVVINPLVDVNTRNVQFRGELKNPNQSLLPGMYAKVEVNLGESRKLITVPRTAISFNPYGSTVYRVESGGKDEKGKSKLVAKQTFVTTGETRGDQIAILSGVSDGDTVVTAGQLKLRNGMPVAIDNSIRPSDEAAPQPRDE